MTTMMPGQRCRSLKSIDGPSGFIKPMSEGIVQYVSENFGRLLMKVDWEGGKSSIIFPEEVELL